MKLRAFKALTIEYSPFGRSSDHGAIADLSLFPESNRRDESVAKTTEEERELPLAWDFGFETPSGTKSCQALQLANYSFRPGL